MFTKGGVLAGDVSEEVMMKGDRDADKEICVKVLLLENLVNISSGAAQEPGQGHNADALFPHDGFDGFAYVHLRLTKA